MYILALYECSRLNCYNVENSIIIERLVKKMYTTQMDAARKGIITKEMKIVAEKENMESNATDRCAFDPAGEERPAQAVSQFTAADRSDDV